MKKIIKIGIAIAILLLATALAIPKVSYETTKAETYPNLTHAQEVWISALEWCESRGKTTAINPKDKDNTPSYYSFQFKPGTFRYYGEKYGVIEKKLSDEKIMELIKSLDLQRKIVQYMVLDKSVKWEHEFPDCVKRKVGFPPNY